MKLITQSALAKELGVSRQAIRYARTKNKIMMDGMDHMMVQYDHEITQIYIQSARARNVGRMADGQLPGQEAAKTKRGRPEKYKKGGDPEPETDKVGAVIQPPPPECQQNTQISQVVQDLSGDVTDTPLELMPQHELDKAKTYHQVIKLKVAIAKDRRKLVSVDDVYRVWARFYAVHTSQLGCLGEKISDTVASLLGTDDPEKVLAVKKEIDDPIYVALAQIKSLMNDFLEESGAKGRIE